MNISPPSFYVRTDEGSDKNGTCIVMTTRKSDILIFVYNVEIIMDDIKVKEKYQV